jgi:hypothetical protein
VFEEARLEVVEFGESESKCIAALYVPQLEILLAVNLIYSQARLTIQTQATCFIRARVALFIIGDTVAGFYEDGDYVWHGFEWHSFMRK